MTSMPLGSVQVNPLELHVITRRCIEVRKGKMNGNRKWNDFSYIAAKNKTEESKD